MYGIGLKQSMKIWDPIWLDLSSPRKIEIQFFWKKMDADFFKSQNVLWTYCKVLNGCCILTYTTSISFSIFLQSVHKC